MNKSLEKVLLQLGMEHDQAFYSGCQRLAEEADCFPKNFTGAELVIIRVLLGAILKQVKQSTKASGKNASPFSDFDSEDSGVDKSRLAA